MSPGWRDIRDLNFLVHRGFTPSCKNKGAKELIWNQQSTNRVQVSSWVDFPLGIRMIAVWNRMLLVAGRDCMFYILYCQLSVVIISH